MSDKDYYAILGVPKNATDKQIKKAFRKIARENHPDQHPGDAKAEQRFKEASEAHDVLSDPEKRRAYDAQRTFGGFGSFGGGGAPGFGRTHTTFTTGNAEDLMADLNDAGLGDLFGNLFGSSGASRSGSRARKGNDLHGSVTISFGDAVSGTTVSVSTQSQQPCSACRGTGAKAGTTPRVCPTCQGSGMQAGALGATSCADCAGRGLIVDDPCEVCHGSGRASGTHSIQVRIPAGIDDGQKLRIAGKGGQGSHGGPNGDLIVAVNVRPHPMFGRDGDNITVTVPVTFAEAALGAEIEVPTLSGETVRLRIPAGTPNGRTFRVRDRGVKKSGKSGDLLASIEVQVPTRLNDAAADALRAYAAAANEPNPRMAGGAR